MLFSIIAAIATLLQFGVGFLMLWAKYQRLYTPSGYLFITASFMMAARNLTAFLEVENFDYTGDTFCAFLDNVYYPFGISALLFISVFHFVSDQYKKKKAP